MNNFISKVSILDNKTEYIYCLLLIYIIFQIDKVIFTLLNIYFLKQINKICFFSQ